MAFKKKLPKYIEELTKDPAIKEEKIQESDPIVIPKRRNTKVFNDPDQMKIEFKESKPKEKYNHHWLIMSKQDIVDFLCFQNRINTKTIDSENSQSVTIHHFEDSHDSMVVFRNTEEKIKVTLSITNVYTNPAIITKICENHNHEKLYITKDIAQHQYYTLTFKLYKTGKSDKEVDTIEYNVSSKSSGIVIEIDPNTFTFVEDAYNKNFAKKGK